MQRFEFKRFVKILWVRVHFGAEEVLILDFFKCANFKILN